MSLVTRWIGRATATARIETVATTVSTVGGVVEVFTTSASGVACRVRQLSKDEREELGRDRVVSTHRHYFEGSVSVVETSRLITTGAGNMNGTHDVLAVDGPHGMGQFFQVDTRLRS